MRNKWLPILFVLAAIGAAPVSALADDETPPSYDGRLDDYTAKSVTLSGGGTALSYFIWAGLGVAAVGFMFKDAKRSHLD